MILDLQLNTNVFESKCVCVCVLPELAVGHSGSVWPPAGSWPLSPPPGYQGDTPPARTPRQRAHKTAHAEKHQSSYASGGRVSVVAVTEW